MKKVGVTQKIWQMFYRGMAPNGLVFVAIELIAPWNELGWQYKTNEYFIYFILHSIIHCY